MGYLNHKYWYQGYSMALDSLFHSSWGPNSLESFAPPSDPGRRHHGPLRTILCHCYAPLLSLSHRRAPQTRFAPRQTATAIG